MTNDELRSISDFDEFVKTNIPEFVALSQKAETLWTQIQSKIDKRRRKEIDIKFTRRECQLMIVAVALSLDRSGRGEATDILSRLGLSNLGLLGNRTLDLE